MVQRSNKKQFKDASEKEIRAELVRQMKTGKKIDKVEKVAKENKKYEKFISSLVNNMKTNDKDKDKSKDRFVMKTSNVRLNRSADIVRRSKR